MSEASPRLVWDALSGSADFIADARFGALQAEGYADSAAGLVPPEVARADPYYQGYKEGFAAAQGEQQQALADFNAQARWPDLALSRLNAESEADLREKLRVTVLALCETALAPLALDEQALLRRIDTALAMLRRAQDDKHVFLNPVDADMLAGALPDGISVETDAGLVRGAIRIETADGGVEDGPAQWRAALEEALDIC